jgi:VWFA-related protein
MKKLLAALSAALACCPLALSGQTAGPTPFGERVDVNIVNVEVWVTDKEGNPVNGLQRGDFEVREDGKPVEVANFEGVRRAAAPVPAGGPSGAPAPPAAAGQGKTAAASESMHLVVYVDNSFLLPAHRNRVLKQLRDFIGQLRPEDEVMLVTSDPGLRIRLPFTRDRAALTRTVDEMEKMGASGLSNLSAKRQTLEAIFTLREANRKIDGPCAADIAQPAHSYAQATRNDVLRSLGTMTVLVNSLSGVPGRKALLLVSDGMPVTPGEEVFQVLAEMCSGSGTSGINEAEQGGGGFGGSSTAYDARQAALDSAQYGAAHAYQAFTAHANAQRVTLYALQASGLEGNGAGADLGVDQRLLQLPSVMQVERTNLQNSMFVLASDTGGRAILDANDLRPDLTRIQEDFTTYYSLAYSPQHMGDGREHRIEVKVKRPGTKVRYRQSYRDKPALERTVDRTLASLFYGYEDNPLDVQVEVGAAESGAKGNWSVPIRLRIPLFKVTLLPTERSFEGKVRLLVATNNAAGKRSPVRQVEVPISIPREKALTALGQYYQYELKLTLEPGAQHVAVAVRDEATTTTSFIARELSVGPADKPAAR